MVKDICGSYSSGGHLTNVNGTLYFSPYDGTDGHGYELWKSDGTEAGTVMVKEITPGWQGSYPYNLTDVNGTLYFIAIDYGAYVIGLWKSDGTEAGTVMVKEIFMDGSYGSYVNNLANVNGTLYFSASEGTHGYELWKSDGTEAGTVMAEDIIPGSVSSSPQYLTVVNDFLFFSADSSAQGRELFALYLGGTSDTIPPVTVAGTPGGSYETPQSVTLTCSDAGGSGCVSIFYTVDGSTPNTASYVYGSPITISYPTTLKFFSMDMAGNIESVKTEVYTVDTIAPTTTASPEGGTFSTPQTISLSCSDGAGSGCAVIYYTLDGSTPGIGKPTYSSPINIASTTTLKFMARDNSGNSESVNTQVYTLPDTRPDAFFFTDQTGAPLNAEAISGPITVAGIEAPAAISITGGKYSINSGPFTSAPGTVNNEDAVVVSAMSSGTYSRITGATLNVGGVSDTFSVTTMPVPTYTISFSFTGSGTMSCAPTTVSSGGSFVCTLSSGNGYHLGSLLDNTADVTAQISGTHYTVTDVTADHN
jgi:ELWxxDGT repeat protein